MLVTFAESRQAALRPGLLVGDVVAAGTPFGWPLRLAQAALAVGAAMVVAAPVVVPLA
jgi:hypothetical protein